MKEAVSSFDLMPLVAELQELIGGHIDKVYQSGEDLFFKVNILGGGKREIFIRPGKWLCLREVAEKPETPPPFAQALRRLLPNASITSIEQRGFDRVVVLGLQTEKEYDMVVELFGGGNLVLVEGGKTVLCQRTQILKNRQIKQGQPYGFPPPGVNPIDVDRDEFHRRVLGGKGAVARVLASDFNLGGLYAEEICLVARIDKKTKSSALSEGQVDGLFTALNNLIVAIQEDRRPALILEGDKPVDAIPIELQTYSSNERQSFPTFSEALAKYLDSAAPSETMRVVQPGEDISAKYQRRMQQQEDSIKTLKDDAVRYELLAFFLYEHFQEFEELLKIVREGQEPVGVRITAKDYEKHTITVAIGEDDFIELDYREDVNGNTQRLYKKRRDALNMAAKVQAALAETRNEMQRAVKKAGRVAARSRAAPTKQFWFENYRWFISSEGFLIIGGRDTRSNESLVKKHMKAGDRYAHADTHGAPSIVVKDGSKAGEPTLKEACGFALTHSKAWSSKLASGSAYWVNPEQVSKSAESGEYVPKGAFVIRGKRNYFKDLEMSVAIGEIEHEGHRKIMAGPVDAVRSRSKRFAILEPGDTSKEKMSNLFAKAFAVPWEEVSRILPLGPFKVVKTTAIELPG